MREQAAAVAASALQAADIGPKDILEWCFVIGSLNLGVIGFLYSTYAAAKFTNVYPPPIVGYLRLFVVALVFVLTVLTLLAVVTAATAGVGVSVWIIVGCFAIVDGCSIVLAKKMD